MDDVDVKYMLICLLSKMTESVRAAASEFLTFQVKWRSLKGTILCQGSRSRILHTVFRFRQLGKFENFVYL